MFNSCQLCFFLAPGLEASWIDLPGKKITFANILSVLAGTSGSAGPGWHPTGEEMR